METIKKRSSNRKFNNGQKNMVKHNNNVKLKKEVGIFGGISLVVGTMIGSGIFLSPKDVLRQSKSVGASLCIWGACGLLSTLSAISFIELGLMIKKNGGKYQYITAAYGKFVGFLYPWTSQVVLKPSSIALISLGFAEYVTAPFYSGCEAPLNIRKCAAAFCIILITTVNCLSVRVANGVQVFFTAAKVLLVVAIITGGCVVLAQGNTGNLSNGFEGSTASFSAVALAFYSGLFSYDGWDQLSYVTEELENPIRNFPLVIMLGIPLTTVFYILVNIAYLSVMTPAELLASPAVAVTFGDRVFGAASFVVPLGVACSTFGAVNGISFTSGRIAYAAAREGHLPQLLSYISVERFTPSPALLVNAFIALVMILPDSSTFSTLVNFLSFTSWIFYGATFLSVIVLRYRHPNWHRPYKVWLVIPAFCFLASIFLVVAPIVEKPQIEYLYATCFMFAGYIFYIPFVHFGKTLPFIDSFCTFIQQLLEIVPPPLVDKFGEEKQELNNSSATKQKANLIKSNFSTKI